MPELSDAQLAGEARRAASTIAEVWSRAAALGEDYSTIWAAKEWLLNAADSLETDGRRG